MAKDGLLTLYLLLFMDLKRRRVLFAGMHTYAKRNLDKNSSGIMDRDTKFCAPFREILAVAVSLLGSYGRSEQGPYTSR